MAEVKTNTDVWIFLREALRLVVDRRFGGGSRDAAASWLIEQLRTARLPSHYRERQLANYPGAVIVATQLLGREPPPRVDREGGTIEPSSWGPGLIEVRWENNSLWCDATYEGGYELLGIEVPLADLLALLPAAVEPEAPVERAQDLVRKPRKRPPASKLERAKRLAETVCPGCLTDSNISPAAVKQLIDEYIENDPQEKRRGALSYHTVARALGRLK